MLKTERFYTDYKFDGKIPYDNALAKALQWLYDESEFNDDRSEMYYMNTRLPLYDFMTLVVLVITSAHGEYAATKLHQIIQTLEEGKDQFDWKEKNPTYKYEGKYILINKMESWTTEVILWAAYIYCLFRTEEWHDDPNAKCHRAKDVLFDVFKKKTGLNDKAFQKHFLMRHRDATMRLLISNWATETNEQKEAPTDRTPNAEQRDEKVAELQTVISEQNTQIAQLQAKVTELQQIQDNAQEDSQEVERWKSEAERVKRKHDELIVELLMPIFFKDKQEVKKFLEKIEGMEDTEITTLVNAEVGKRTISSKSKRRPLWRILHAAKYYSATEQNWNDQVK